MMFVLQDGHSDREAARCAAAAGSAEATRGLAVSPDPVTFVRLSGQRELQPESL